MANNPRHKENLKPFPKGNNANPKGRPKKLPAIEIILANVLGEEKDGKTAAEAILMALRARAMKGGAEGNRAAELLLNRGYGLPKQPIEGNFKHKIVVEYGNNLTQDSYTSSGAAEGT